MSAVPAMLAMFYGALPPEVNTARLMAGAGIEPMYQAAAGWETLAVSLETQAEELAASLVALQGSWRGQGSDRAVQATAPMVAWLRTTALQAQKRAMQAIAQATAYTTAMVTTPPLPEIEMNHVTQATLEATNFLGVNTVPIGLNEADYVRMWNQAAGAMEGYQAETSLNTVFEPILPMTPIVIPGVGAATAATAVAQNAALAPGAAVREAAFAHVAAQATVESIGLQMGNVASQGNMAATRTEGAAQRAENGGQQAGRESQGMQQGVQMATQMVTQTASQVGSMMVQLPQQAMQQVTQPMQQVTQIFTQVGSSFGSARGAQVGLLGANPFSSHPLAGGSGASTGAGLVRAASLPGMGGTSARSPLMSSLVGGSPETSPASAARGASAGAGGPGSAPVGGAPMATAGNRAKSGGSRAALTAPSPLPNSDEEDDDW